MANTAFEVKGTITEVLKGGKFKVQIEGNGLFVICTPSGRIRMNKIHLIPGDNVTVEVCPEDVTKGRIVWRDK